MFYRMLYSKSTLLTRRLFVNARIWPIVPQVNVS